MFLQSVLLNSFSDVCSHGFFSAYDIELNPLNVAFNGVLNADFGVNNNRKKIMQIFNGKHIYFNKQNHSNEVVYIKQEDMNIIQEKYRNSSFLGYVADSIITNVKNLVIGVYTADCVPLLILDKKFNQVACIHVSSKTLRDDIIKNTIDKMLVTLVDKIDCDRFYCSFGPAIYVESYVVGKDFYNHFIQKSNEYKKFFIITKNQEYFFNLQEAIVYELNKLNIFNIEKIYKNTAIDEKYYSYRRSLGVETNRQASVIMLKE
jgi:YfiH family protein